MVSIYIAYVGSKINYFCSHSKLNCEILKCRSPSDLFTKGKSNVKYEPNLSLILFLLENVFDNIPFIVFRK